MMLLERCETEHRSREFVLVFVWEPTNQGAEVI